MINGSNTINDKDAFNFAFVDAFSTTLLQILWNFCVVFVVMKFMERGSIGLESLLGRNVFPEQCELN